MGREIERKFQVRGDAWREGARAARRIRQGYLVARPDRSVRVRVDGGDGSLTIKGAARGAVRDEWEYPIPASHAREILESLSEGCIVEKTRHQVPVGDLLFEVDEFHGANQGLVVAEVELEREGQEVPRPEWLGEELTDDPRFLNASLALRPWSTWGAEETDALGAAVARSAAAARQAGD